MDNEYRVIFETIYGEVNYAYFREKKSMDSFVEAIRETKDMAIFDIRERIKDTWQIIH